MERNLAYQVLKVDKVKLWLLFIFLGWSYGSLGKPFKQALFYLTLGGFGFWSVYVLFTLNRKINKFNARLALNLGK